jgi:hypothetical protein
MQCNCLKYNYLIFRTPFITRIVQIQVEVTLLNALSKSFSDDANYM